MRNQPCEHLVLEDMRAPVRLARCARHSRATGVTVWVWGTSALRRPCACGDSERFLVTTEQANTRWSQSADVLLGQAQATALGALRVAAELVDLPGCSLVIVPAGRHGAVFRTRTHHVVLTAQRGRPAACEACLYPWLTAGHCLDELAERLPAAVSFGH